MKKQNSRNESDYLNQISEKEIEKIWKISIAELREEGMTELDDYPEIVEKIRASLQVVLDGRKKINKKKSKISGKELAGPVLEILKYVMIDIYRKHIENSESCNGMYV